jgi:hypothetical protein
MAPRTIILAAGLVFGFALSSTACFLTPRSDGETCEHGSDCLSDSCVGGICVFSSCNDTSDCESGFACEEAPGWAEWLSLGIAQGACNPTCDACPWQENPRWTCNADSSCSYDGSPWVDIGGPYEAKVGESVTLVGSVETADGRELQSVVWQANGVEVGTGLEISTTFAMPGYYDLTLVATDVDARIGAAATSLAVCADEAMACAWEGDCCAGFECRDDDQDGTGTCLAPLP